MMIKSFLFLVIFAFLGINNSFAQSKVVGSSKVLVDTDGCLTNIQCTVQNGMDKYYYGRLGYGAFRLRIKVTEKATGSVVFNKEGTFPNSRTESGHLSGENLEKGDTYTGYIKFDKSCYGYPTNQTFFEKFTLELIPLD